MLAVLGIFTVTYIMSLAGPAKARAVSTIAREFGLMCGREEG